MAFVRVLAFSLLTRSVVATLGDHQTCGAGEDCGSEETSLLAVPIKRNFQTQAGVAEAPTLLAMGVAVNTTSWNCPDPYVATECVWSSWHGWQGDRSKFQGKCNGNLVSWGWWDRVDDCGWPCIGCSYIKACCDDCRKILSVTGYWESVGFVDVDTHRKLIVGVVVNESETWSRTNSWSTSVSTEASSGASVEVEGVGVKGSRKLSAQASHEFERSFSASWSKTVSETDETSWTQPAGTTGWVWATKIESTCGIRRGKTRSYQSTPNQNPPCCMPGANATSNLHGDCAADAAGEIINLCKGSFTYANGTVTYANVQYKLAARGKGCLESGKNFGAVSLQVCANRAKHDDSCGDLIMFPANPSWSCLCCKGTALERNYHNNTDWDTYKVGEE